ncbi:MAG TPA: hypothetical protein VMU34_18750 [Mycobacterium sp.]|nr:hypothetical protein [Mycobacterium sp.]
MVPELSILGATPRRRLVVAVICAGAVVAAAGCHGSGPGVTSQGGVAIFNNLSVEDLIASIAQAKLPVPNPRNVTAQECPTIGCIEKVDTDTVAVMKFPTTGKAELYAGATPQSFQVTDVVMTFDPGMPANERQHYEQVVTRDIQ